MEALKKSIVIFLLVLAGCTKETPEETPGQQHDYLVQANATNIITKELITAALTLQDYAQYASLIQDNVHTVRVVYATEYPDGTKLHVSGALLIAENYDSRFPVVVFNHGTNNNRNSAPSIEIQGVPSSLEVFLSAAIASAFHAAVLVPDYIGYGESKSVTHPYMHGASLGQTGLDFIRAFREYATDPMIALPFNPQVFITGYSEGGYAAVALHKAIDAHSAEGLQVVKNVAGAGAYDLLAFSKEVLANPDPLGSKMISSYLWVLDTYKTNFQYTKNYADVFSAADNAMLANGGKVKTYVQSGGDHDTTLPLYVEVVLSRLMSCAPTVRP